MWKKEMARDLMALGSIPFYTLVMVRAFIGSHYPFVAHIALAFLIFALASLLIRPAHARLGRALILSIFTSFFYQARLYALFTILVFLGMIMAAKFLKEKNSDILRGIILGAASVLISYVIVLRLPL